MDSTEKTVREIIIASVHEGKLPEGVIYEDVFREMKAQTVHALPYALLDRLEMSEELRSEWKKACMLQLMHYSQAIGAQKKVTELLDRNGIQSVILKGSAAAQYYPHPELRCTGDVDILVRPEDYENAVQLLRENGCAADVDFAEKRHTHFSLNEIRIELHGSFATMDDGTAAKKLDGILIDAFERAEDHILPDQENGLVLLQHVNQHIMRGIGLRQIIDWMMFAEEHLDEDFLALADSVGLKQLAVSVTQMCQEYLGMKNILPDGNQKVLWEHVLKSGNFGRKIEAGTEKSTESTALEVKGFAGWLKRPYYSGLSHLKLQSRWYYVLPVWIYGAVRYAVILLRHGNPIKIIREGRKAAAERQERLADVGITRFSGEKDE